MGNGAVIQASETGTLKLQNTTLPGTLFVPALGHNLISVGACQANSNTSWTFSGNQATLVESGRKLLSADLHNGLFILDKHSAPSPSALLVNVPDSTLFLWHRRLGHLNVRDVVRLGREGRLDNKVDWGKVSVEMNGFQCPACIQGKGARLPSPSSNLRASRPISTIHVDLWGPARTPSIGGSRYFLTCYDDFSRKISLTFLKNKSDTRRALINYINLVENQLNLTVKVVRSDRGGEFSAGTLESYFLDKGIEHHEVPPAAHAQNGRVERAHRTILDSVRTLLFDSSLPDRFWAEAANYAVYTGNRCPSGPSKDIPEDLWRQYSVVHDHLQPFGALVYFRDHVESDKLHRRYRPGRLLSYIEGTRNYRIWDSERSKVIISRDAVFDRSPVDEPMLPVDDVLPTAQPHGSETVILPLAEDNLPNDISDEHVIIDKPRRDPPRRNPSRQARPTGSLSVNDLSRSSALRPEAAQAAPPEPAPRVRYLLDSVEIPTRRRSRRTYL